MKTILVCLNDVDRLEPVLSAASGLAQDFDAHLIGLYVLPAIRVYPAVSMHITPDVFDAQRSFFEERSSKVKASFEEAVRRNSLRGEWRKVDSDSPMVADPVIEHGRQADLIVAAQTDAERDDGVEGDFAERLLMECGRPVLLIPRVGTYRTIGKTMLIGWNSRREAVRAAFDALPLMMRSERTWLVWADPQAESERAGSLPGAEMATTLARHGVNITSEAMPTGGLSAGEALLNRVSDHGADLLVMGAYGHSRMREFVFGGATRFVLQHMTVPVLMSH